MRKTKGVFHWSRREVRIAVLLVVAITLMMFAIAPWKSNKTFDAAPEQEAVKERRLIDGVFMLPNQVNPLIAGVMIENMIEAQPISGIADARLVYEAITEANITRFLAYFVLPSPPAPLPEEEDADALAGAGEGFIEIGPVRSARPYFLDWAAEFNTIFAHVGSSPRAYDLLRKTGVEGVRDLDQWYKSEYYFQKQGRTKPHHLYTTTELLISAGLSSARAEDNPARFESWKFKNDASPDLRGNVNDIRVNYAAPYNVEWLYDKSENYYKRMQWARPTFVNDKSSVGQGGLHKDAKGKEIIAKNIAVAFMDMDVLDEIGRKNFETIGQGKGLVFQDGRVIVGTWKKSSAQERTRWYDSQENEVEFNAGTTWIEIVPEGWRVEY